MAALDYTQIVFKNGKLMRNVYDDNNNPRLPFSFDRMGHIIGSNLTKNKFNYKFDDNDYQTYYSYNNKNIVVFGYENESYSAFYYMDDKNLYVVLGGYGHFENPYLHFYERGYGILFERKMCAEAYDWLMGDILFRIIKHFHSQEEETCNDYFEYEAYLVNYRNKIYQKYGYKKCNKKSVDMIEEI